MQKKHSLAKLIYRSLVASVFMMTVGLMSSDVLIAADNNPQRIGPDVTVDFPEKKSGLTLDAKSKIDELIRNARARGQIKEIQVAVWSDNPVPRPTEQLSKSDRVLAEQRAKNLTTYLKSRSKVGVSTHNMAERASWLAKMFDTTDAELKSEIGHDGRNYMSSAEFQVFKDNGNPSKAVVLVIMKQ